MGERLQRFSVWLLACLLTDVVAGLSKPLGAEFVVHLSDEYWYRDPNASRQSASLDILRAVEMRRALVRASNATPSWIIDPWGRVTQSFQDSEGGDCFTPGWVAGEIALV